MLFRRSRSVSRSAENTPILSLTSRTASPVGKPVSGSSLPSVLRRLSAGVAVVVAGVNMSVAAVQTPPSPASVNSPVSASEVTAMDRVGSVTGQFQVDNSGAAAYSIPIFTPEGTAGVTPTVNLNY